MGLNLGSIGNALGGALQTVKTDVTQATQAAATDVASGLNQAADTFKSSSNPLLNLGANAASTLATGIDTSMGPVGPAPTLQRPVVMITGLTMQASSYDPMAQHLASNPANGQVAVYAVADGQFHQGSVTGPVMTPQQASQSKIFEVQYLDPNAAPTDKAPQLAQAMNAIQQATGTGNVDVVCHSAGCTDFRLYLQDRTPAQQSQLGIAHAVFVGPATDGTEMGNLGAAVGQVAGLNQAGSELAVGSPLVASLNSSWSNQLAQVQQGVTVVGLEGAPTPSANGIVNGDGFMPASQVGLPGANTVLLQGIDPTPLMHLDEIHYSGVLNTVDSVLGS